MMILCSATEEDEPILEVKYHYTRAQINGCIFDLGDCALIRVSSEINTFYFFLPFLKSQDTSPKGTLNC